MSDRIRTFAEFWPFYLGQHAKPATRALHVVGTTAALGCAALAVVRGSPVPAVIGLGIGYGLAWVGHFFIEHNRPATFRYPLWSFLADWKMWFLAVTGRLGRELERAAVRQSDRVGGAPG